MGCGCNKGSTAGRGGSLPSWKVTYDDGRSQIYLHEDQARREAERAGAQIEQVVP